MISRSYEESRSTFSLVLKVYHPSTINFTAVAASRNALLTILLWISSASASRNVWWHEGKYKSLLYLLSPNFVSRRESKSLFLFLLRFLFLLCFLLLLRFLFLFYFCSFSFVKDTLGLIKVEYKISSSLRDESACDHRYDPLWFVFGNGKRITFL